MTWTDADVVVEKAWTDADIADEPNKQKPPRQQLPPNLEILRDLVAGGLRGASSIGSTILAPFQAAWEGTGQTGAQQLRAKRIADVDSGLQTMGADPESLSYALGKGGAEIAGTAGVMPAAPAASMVGRMAQNAIAGAGGTALVSPEDTALGAGIGAAVPVAGKVLSAGARTVGGAVDALGGNVAKLRAAQMLRDVAGPQLDAVRSAWRGAPTNVTAAQAAAGVNRDAVQALGELARHGDPDAYRLIAESLKGGQQGVLSGMARGSTAESAALSRDLFSKMSAAELVPIRESILAKLKQTRLTLDELLPQLQGVERQYVAALQNQGRMATDAAQQGVSRQGSRATERQMVNALPEGNFPRETSMPVSPRVFRANPLDPSVPATGQGDPSAAQMSGTPFVQRGSQADYAARAAEATSAADELGGIASRTRAEADAFRQQISDLPSAFTAAPIRDAVSAAAARTVNPAEEAVMTAVSKALQRAGDDPVEIAKIRTLGVNQLMGDLISTGKLSKTDAAAALGNVKKLIDKQLGPEIVERYYRPFSKKLEYRSSLELADNLRQLQKDSPTQFLKVLRGDDPDLVAKYGDWKTIQEALGSKRFGKAAEIAGQMERDIASGERASGATKQLSQLLGNDKFGFRLPGFLSAKATVTNATLDAIESRLNKKTMQYITDAMKSGASAEELVSKIPTSERNLVLKWITQKGPERYMQAAVPVAAQQ